MKYWPLLAGLLVASPALASDGNSFLEKKCGSCHDLYGPAAQTLEELWQRKAPDLFYAGSKYERNWLANWLTNPKRIRPAGYHYYQNIKPGKKRDMVNKENLKIHMSLTRDEANIVADSLMAFKASPDMLKKKGFRGGSTSMTFGEMVFDKFSGCTACHEIEPGFGGLSGPEMYTAVRRMQKDYLVHYIRNPQMWNPKTAMPNKHIAESNIQKIVQYLKALSDEDWDEQN